MLKSVLIANGVSCLLFGALFTILPDETAQFLGTPPNWLVIVVGIGLIGNAFALFWTARSAKPRRLGVLFFVVGDLAWVVATVLLVAIGIWITNSTAIAYSLIVAVWVAACGYTQFRLLPETEDV